MKWRPPLPEGPKQSLSRLAMHSQICVRIAMAKLTPEPPAVMRTEAWLPQRTRAAEPYGPSTSARKKTGLRVDSLVDDDAK